jgi:hypothetical protein
MRSAKPPFAMVSQPYSLKSPVYRFRFQPQRKFKPTKTASRNRFAIPWLVSNGIGEGSVNTLWNKVYSLE